MARRVVHILQSRFRLNPGPGLPSPKPSLHPILDTMARDDVGHHAPGNRMETHADRYPAIARKHSMDGTVHSLLENLKV